jgi:hypothetical protein
MPNATSAAISLRSRTKAKKKANKKQQSYLYNPQRKSNMFDPANRGEPYRLSRTRIELFIKCPKCFYMDRRLGLNQIRGYQFTLNNTVDELLKKEFDIYRAKKQPHPLMSEHGIDAVPFDHPDMDTWRDAKHRGITVHNPRSNLLFTGGIDDIWMKPSGELIIVDYKATSKKDAPSSVSDLYDSYKRQMEMYQWLFRQNGYPVSRTGYFVYCNGKKTRRAFRGQLHFDINMIAYNGDDSWVDGVVVQLIDCLNTDKLPPSGKTCEHCLYVAAREKITA